jgi:hypothetical protein
MFRRLLAAASAVVVLSGCYQVNVDTGLPASRDTIEKPFALGFVYGLVPPPTVETASKCKNGVSKVESQMSVVNLLVAVLTSGILTPWTIKITCASSNKAASLVPAEAVRVSATSANTSADYDRVVATAAQLSREIGQAVYVTR